MSTRDSESPLGFSLPAPVRAGAFWAAVVLPFCALAFLVTGLSTTTEYLIFVSVVAANVIALLIGHGYGAEH